MKYKIFQRFFDRKPCETDKRTRRLLLESLENREMLNVDWSGFGSEIVSTYSAETTGDYSVDLTGDVDACKLTDVDGDGRNELVAVDYASKTISVYANSANDGAFQLKGSQTLGALSGVKGYDSVIIDGDSLIVVSASTGVGLTATEYAWNSTTSAYAQSSQTDLDVSKFNSSNADILIFVGVDAAIVNDSEMIVQATTLTTSGTSLATARYSGFGTSSFGSDATIVRAITEELMGSTTIDGTDYLILKESTSSANNLVLASLGATVSKYTYEFSSYGSSLTFDWVAEQDGFLVIGAMTGGKSGLITIKSTAPSNDLVASDLGQWIDCDGVKFNSSSAGAIGDVGGDSDPEVFVVNGSSYMFYDGDASSTYQYAFTASEAVVSSPEYVSVDVEDIDGDGDLDAILVGANHLYVASVSSTGAVENVKSAYDFSQPVKKGVFGDFNGDGLVDVAVQFKANVGSGVQVFQQLSDGSFVALPVQTFSGSLVDVAVGKFSQTSVDEIVALTTKSGTTSTTTVNAIKLDGGSFTATRTYVASGSLGAALAVGKLYDSTVDDVVVVNTTQDTITVLKNGGSSFTGATITTAYDSTSTAGSRPTSAAIGDFNGDGLSDLAVLNSSAGTNYANIVYYLRSADSGLGIKPSGKTLISGTTSVSGLVSADLNADGYFDLAYARKTTGGRGYVSALMGNGTSTVFDSVVNAEASVDASSNFAMTLARVDSDNSSYDVVWAQDKNVGVLLNGDATVVASGELDFVLQSLSSEAGATHDAALSTQRDWIDEWSNFYVDIWASADGVAVSSATAVFSYNESYFTLADVEAASGYEVSYEVASGTATVSVSGSATTDDSGWVLLARMKFAPTGGEGVPLPEDGVLTSVPSEFAASISSQSLNGSTVSSATAPSPRLYPVVFDADENGISNTGDLAYVRSCLGQSVASLDEARFRIFDYDQNATINTGDLSYFVQALGTRYSDGADSVYSSEPPTASSSALLDESFATLDSSDSEVAFLESAASDALLDESDVESVARSFAFYGPEFPSLSDVGTVFSEVEESVEVSTSLIVDLDAEI